MSVPTIDRQELMRRLRLPPRTIRALIADWGQWLSAPQEGRFTARDVARLQVAARMTQRGYAAEEIAREIGQVDLEARPESAPPAAEAALTEAQTAVAAAPPSPSIREQLAEFRVMLTQDVERQRVDRDRILMALMRTQQEVMLLRSELGLQRTRRDRKRSILRRLIG